MPKSKEFTIRLEDRPGSFGKCCQAIAERGVNILAFEAYNHEGQGLVHMVVDNPSAAKNALDTHRFDYKEDEIVYAKLPHRPGELGRAATKLGEGNVNINHTYCGTEAPSNTPLVFFHVSDVNKAAKILEEVMAKAA
jgi:hypothetical protein